jgi:hypothetical protein
MQCPVWGKSNTLLSNCLLIFKHAGGCIMVCVATPAEVGSPACSRCSAVVVTGLQAATDPFFLFC